MEQIQVVLIQNQSLFCCRLRKERKIGVIFYMKYDYRHDCCVAKLWNKINCEMKRQEEDPRLGFSAIFERRKKYRKKYNNLYGVKYPYRDCRKNCEWKRKETNSYLILLFFFLSSAGVRNTFWCIQKRLEREKERKWMQWYVLFFKKKKKKSKNICCRWVVVSLNVYSS